MYGHSKGKMMINHQIWDVSPIFSKRTISISIASIAGRAHFLQQIYLDIPSYRLNQYLSPRYFRLQPRGHCHEIAVRPCHGYGNGGELASWCPAFSVFIQVEDTIGQPLRPSRLACWLVQLARPGASSETSNEAGAVAGAHILSLVKKEIDMGNHHRVWSFGQET